MENTSKTSKKTHKGKVWENEYIKIKAFHSMKNTTSQSNGWLVGSIFTAVHLAPIHGGASGFKLIFFSIFHPFPRQSLCDIYSFAKVLTNVIYVVVDIWKSL